MVVFRYLFRCGELLLTGPGLDAETELVFAQNLGARVPRELSRLVLGGRPGCHLLLGVVHLLEGLGIGGVLAQLPHGVQPRAYDGPYVLGGLVDGLEDLVSLGLGG